MMIIISKFINHRQKLGNIEFSLFVYNISWRITYCEFLLSVVTACEKWGLRIGNQVELQQLLTRLCASSSAFLLASTSSRETGTRLGLAASSSSSWVLFLSLSLRSFFLSRLRLRLLRSRLRDLRLFLSPDLLLRRSLLRLRFLSLSLLLKYITIIWRRLNQPVTSSYKIIILKKSKRKSTHTLEHYDGKITCKLATT